MKYGDTLRQRSIAAWQSHNIDYQDIKHFIKVNTSPGKGKAVSIPGTTNTDAEEFEKRLFDILSEQDERITWFVRSKVGEIQRRLSHLEDQIDRFAVRSQGRTTVKRLERYHKIETDILRVGEEIQALSRFIGVQQEAFRKLIKKYKKWTGSSELGHRFNVEVRQHTDSFVYADLKPLLHRYEELLHAIRLLHQHGKNGGQHGEAQVYPSRLPVDAAPLLRQAAFVLDNGKRVDFDKLLGTLASGENSKEATYWVHPENIVEVQILVQQYTKSFNALVRRPSVLSCSSAAASPSRARLDTQKPDTFDIVVDDADDYLPKNGTSQSLLGARLQRAALHARGVADEDSSLLTWEKHPASPSANLESCAIKQKCLRSVLTPGLNVVSRKASLPQLAVDGPTDEDPAETLDELQAWLKKHSDFTPMASILSQRSRFYNTSKNNAGVLIAALDQQVQFQSGLATQSDGSAVNFPYAVLTVRQEGSHNGDMINALDESHLVERIPLYSLEYHAVYAIQAPSSLPAPSWLPLLKRDLRKMPSNLLRPARRISNDFGSQSTTPRASATSSEAGHRPIKSSRRPLPVPSRGERYWNEYDDPSDEEDGYVIYLDPNYESFWDKSWSRLAAFFSPAGKGKPSAERERLLYSPDLESADSVEDLESSDDDEAVTNYRISRIYPRDGAALVQTSRNHLASVPRLTATCFASSFAILVVAFVLAATGKRKLHAEVDAGVIFAVATSLTFAVTGVASLWRGHEDIGVAVWVAAGVGLCIVAAGSGGLLAWMLA